MTCPEFVLLVILVIDKDFTKMDDLQLLRYNRQIMLPGIDIEGQEKLLAASVLIIGLGGLGSPVAMYLAAAGIGHLVLNDFDQVSLSNLQRQVVHKTKDIGRSKVLSARETLSELNPTIEISCLPEKLSSDDLSYQVSKVDVVVDASDNFATRFMVNEACVKNKTALVSGAAIRFEGQVMVYDPRYKESPCYSCLYENLDDSELNCAVNGVAATTVGVIGSLQATEVLKLIIGIGESLAGYLLLFDAINMEWKKMRLPRKKDCPVCGIK